MDIVQNTQTFGSRSQSNSAANAAGTISSDFETFLRLLTTQMQNQDPLNPMESTEFASQLAQFSAVEQQVRSNELLVGLQAGLQTLGLFLFAVAKAFTDVVIDKPTRLQKGIANGAADKLESAFFKVFRECIA